MYYILFQDTSVGYLKAQDRDTGVPNPLVLKIVSQPEDQKFYLGPSYLESGTTSVYRAEIRATGRIDRDTSGEMYEFKVEVSVQDPV